MHLLLRLATRRSLLLRAAIEPQAAYLGGLPTYVMKIGPDNLAPPFDSRIDRQVAAAPAVTSMRIRLQQVARLTAKGLEEDLAKRPGVPLHLINIGGGPAIDSINALILLKDTGLLARPVTIQVLDVDAGGPHFGASALAALGADGAPLAKLDVSLVHMIYDWNDTEPLRRLIEAIAAKPAIIAASSEGALFDYAGDDAVLANLEALHAGGRGACIVVGSITRADEITRRVLSSSPFKLVPRGIDEFSVLSARAGFHVADAEAALISDQVLLRPR
jgi:hypothetical protein